MEVRIMDIFTMHLSSLLWIYVYFRSDASTALLLNGINGDNTFEVEWAQHSKSSPVTLRCGWSNCGFNVKVYRFPDAHAAEPTSPV
jgi:hypothetical protein